ncbi:MAG: UDP-3-O-(3-hydroxymyristoyl)glucosamine N-acyltransferase [Thiotrichales bacterium]
MISLGALAEQLGLDLSGDPDKTVEAVNTLAKAGNNELSFFSDSRYRTDLLTTSAAVVILKEGDSADCPVATLVAKSPYLAYARAAQLIYKPEKRSPGIHPSAVIHQNSQVHPTAQVGAQVVIEARAVVGADVILEPGAYIGPDCIVGAETIIGVGAKLIADVHMGVRCRILPGAVIGSQGFGFAPDEAGEWTRIPQVGGVLLGDDVEVGSNTTIDCGAIEPTRIGNGVKLDNLIQVAHNVEIGDHTAIAGCTGIAGSAKIGRHCAIGGGAGIVGHIEIADHVIITGTSFITQDIKEPGTYSSGVPFSESGKWRRNYVRFNQLDQMARRLKQVEKQLEGKKKEK